MKISLEYKIGIIQNLCTGCQACVLACAYHHFKKFCLTRKSSIQIFRNNENGEVEIRYDQVSCDMCPDEDTPLCIQFCPVGAIRFIRTKKNNL